MTKDSLDDETMEELTKLGDILQAVHNEETDEMVRISEEKHQLGKCLDIMSSELDKLHSSIVNQDNPQRVLDSGAALDVMLDAIELGHNRAEQLESKIGILQGKIEKESAEDVNTSVKMNDACKTLHDHRVQLAEKTSQMGTYAQALREITMKIEEADDSQEKLANAFQIAEKLRKRLQECDAALESTCQSQEAELAKVKNELDASDYTLSETLEAREAHIKELEQKLLAKDREVEATQLQLQTLELAIDANKERARKLELELQALSNLQWQISTSSPSRIPCRRWTFLLRDSIGNSEPEFRRARKDRRHIIRVQEEQRRDLGQGCHSTRRSYRCDDGFSWKSTCDSRQEFIN